MGPLLGGGIRLVGLITSASAGTNTVRHLVVRHRLTLPAPVPAPPSPWYGLPGGVVAVHHEVAPVTATSSPPRLAAHTGSPEIPVRGGQRVSTQALMRAVARSGDGAQAKRREP